MSCGKMNESMCCEMMLYFTMVIGIKPTTTKCTVQKVFTLRMALI